jgi:hypothetical protein
VVYKTFAQIKSKVERMLDIEVEEFIQPQEFIDYVNDGIAYAEAEIHKLGLEDMYFLTKANIAMVNGQADYSLPANIYMNKIKSVQYLNGSTIYTIRRLRGPDMFEERDYINQYNSVTDFYKYLLRNDSAAQNVILELIPSSRETSSTNLTVWYIREANKWEDDETALCDLPQIAMQFLEQYVTCAVYDKEGHSNMVKAADDLEKIRTIMIATMEQMVADNETEVWKDMSHYRDMR